MEECYALICFKFKVNIKTVPYSRIVWSVRYKIKISGANPRPGNQTSAARYWAADHSLSSTVLNHVDGLVVSWIGGLKVE